MKHLQTFESFVGNINEATEKGIYFDPASSIVDGSNGVIYGIPAPMGRSPFSSAGLYFDPSENRITGFYDSNGRIIYYIGPFTCSQKSWLELGPQIAEDLNAILQSKPDALKGFAGKNKPNAAPLKVIVDTIKKHFS